MKMIVNPVKPDERMAICKDYSPTCGHKKS